ncbi:MAG: beta-lactamase family protein [Candidatus Eremiobacteraeota bacterium]|nr:beta-lactamase family protein [Candidatus Eremiobacteraeota bacterium]
MIGAIRLRAVLAALAAAAVFLVVAPAAPVASDEMIPITGEPVAVMAPFEAKAVAAMQRTKLPGMAVAVAKNGRLVYARGFGYLDAAKKIPMPPDALFMMASISKSFTGVATYQLVQEGRIDVDHTVFGKNGYLSTLTPPPPYVIDPRLEKATVRDFLAMTVAWTEKTCSGKKPVFSGDPTTPEAMIAQQIAYCLANPPGQAYKYVNADFDILGLVIAARNAQHLGYEAYMQQQLFHPLGIEHMYLAHQPGKEVVHYAYPSRQWPPPTAPSIPLRVRAPAGGWVTNTIDLMRLQSALRNLGGFRSPLSPQTTAAFVAPPDVPYYKRRKNQTRYWVSGWDSVSCPCVSGAMRGGKLVNGVDASWRKGGDLPGTLTGYQSDPDGLSFVILLDQHNTAAMPAINKDLLIPFVRAVKHWPNDDQFPKYPG